MKTRYSHSGRVALFAGTRLVAALLVAALVLFGILRFIFPDALSLLARPLSGTGSALSAAVGNASVGFSGRASTEDSLTREVERLTAENAVLSARLADLGALAPTEASIKAGVLLRPPMSPYDTLVLGSGRSAGIREGAAVTGPGGAPVGVVERVGEYTAHVALYSSPGRETQGWIGEARLPVSIVGAGSGAFRAEIAKDALPQVGDTVYVPGAGALPLGSVARVDTDASSPVATLFIRPLINPFTLTWVSVGGAIL